MGMVAGTPSGSAGSCAMSISGAGGISGGVFATLGREAGGGGTKTLGAAGLWNQHEVVPSDNARINGSSRKLNMMHHSRELEAERGSPAHLAGKVDSTIM